VADVKFQREIYLITVVLYGGESESARKVFGSEE
jgi:hypothetical protein